MRYLYYILFILVVSSAIIGYQLRSKVPSSGEAAIIINDKVITVKEFQRLYSSRPIDSGDKSDFINSLITKELLIQESQKEGIDKEESFRRSIQNFYEQSLIKLLMDRKCACLNISVSDDELDKYIALLNKKIELTIFDFAGVEEARKSDYRGGEHRSIYFKDLSTDMKNSVLSLQEGKMTGPLKSGERYMVIRLDKVEETPSQAPSDEEKDKIRKMLAAEKKEKALNDWVADLKKKASIKVLISGKQQGGLR